METGNFQSKPKTQKLVKNKRALLILDIRNSIILSAIKIAWWTLVSPIETGLELLVSEALFIPTVVDPKRFELSRQNANSCFFPKSGPACWCC